MPLLPLPQGKPLDVPRTLQQALELYHQGKIAESERLYAAVYAVRPTNVDALQMLTVIKLGQGELGTALRLVLAAMQERPKSPQILFNYGLVLVGLKRHAEALVKDAENCARSMAWRPRFGGREAAREYPVEIGPRDESARQLLMDLGLRGDKFENRLGETERLLSDRAAGPFERGIQALGELLGFESVHPGSTGSPDGAWRDAEAAWFVFEAKTEVAPTTPIAIKDVRQAVTHPSWLENAGWTRHEKTFVTNAIVTDQSSVQSEAAGIAGSTVRVTPKELSALATSTFGALRAVRAKAPGMSEEELAAAIHRAFADAGLGTDRLCLQLTQRPISRLRRAG